MARHSRESPNQKDLFAAQRQVEFAISEETSRQSHRQRLRNRFMEGGAAAMPDYELLELILFRAIPRQEVKPLAKQLLREFGDFNAVLAAPVPRLLRQKGVGRSVVEQLKIVEGAAHRMMKARIMRREVLGSWNAVLDYCRVKLAYRDTEQFRILFLDRQSRLIADERQQSGTVDHVPVYPREVAKRALELGASALILVHNHPSGDVSPSEGDIVMTEAVRQALAALSIQLYDHIIVGKGAELSFAAEGLLEQREDELPQFG